MQLISSIVFFGRLQIKDLRKTPFWSADMHSVLTEEQTQTCPDCCPKDKNLRAQVTNLFDDFQKEIVKAVQPVVSLYSSRMHTLWHSFQNSLDNSSVAPNCRSVSRADLSDVSKGKGVAEIDISVEEDQSGSVQPASADDLHNPNLVDAAGGKCKATPDEAATSEGLGGILSTETSPASAAIALMTNDQSTSFLEVPSFSQDSSKSSKHALSHDGNEFQAKSADSSMGSSGQLPSVLKPETHSRAADVFPSQRKTILNNLQTMDSKPVGDSDRAAPEGTSTVSATEFWGNGAGFDSDCEVKSPSEASGTAKEDQDMPNAAKRRWPPSLNESALYSIKLAKKKREQAVSHCAQKSSSEGHLVLEGNPSCQKQQHSRQHSDSQQHNVDTELPTTPIEPAATIDEDEPFDIMAIDQLFELAPTTKVKKFHYDFSSTIVEKENFKDIVARIPFSGPRPRIVEINRYWVDHKTFGLSMRQSGAVSKHVIDIMGQAVMAEQAEKIESNLMSSEAWYRHVVIYERARMLQVPNVNILQASNLFSHQNHGYRLDAMHLIFFPLYLHWSWYVVVADFRTPRFDVLSANLRQEEIQSDAEIVVSNFKKIFRFACPHSTKVKISEMQTVYKRLTTTTNNFDSGILIMKLMQSHDGE